jgi:hypothetical protein
VLRLAIAAIVLVTVALGATPLAVQADRGVAMDVGAIDVDDRLSRGGEYRLPDLGVRNPGTERTTYAMGVGHVVDQSGREAPPAWFGFEPAELTLDPGEAAPVSVTLDIPSGARPDDYEALLRAEIVTGNEGTTVGAAAATRITFTVKPSNLLQAWQLEAEDWFRDNQPWATIVPLAAVLAAVLWFLRRRFTFSVQRRA